AVVRAIVTIQSAGTQRDPQFAGRRFEHGRYRTIADTVGALRIVMMMTERLATIAKFVQTRVYRAHPQRTAVILREMKQIVAGEAVGIGRIVAIVDEARGSGRQTAQTRAARRHPKTAVARAREVLDQIGWQRIRLPGIRQKAVDHA